MLGIIKKINTIITIAGAAYTTYDTMMKAFKWYEKRHGGKKDTPIIRPIIKGQ